MSIDSFDAQHEKLLDRARLALDRECQVPIEYTVSYLDVFGDHAMAPYQLAKAFVARGRSAELDGRPDDAVRSYLDTIRLGRAAARGGLLVDWLVGSAMEGMGVHRLYGVRNSLAPDQCRPLIGRLQTLDANREPLDEVCYRDKVWTIHAFGWPCHLWLTLERLYGSEDPFRPMTETGERRSQTKMRILICELAIRIYRAEQGKLPERLADLVPEILPALPEDPHSGRPLVYRRTDKGHELYSTGIEDYEGWGAPPTAAEPDDGPIGDVSQ